MEYLSVEEYAQLRGCTSRYVNQLIQKGKVRAELFSGLKGGGNGGEVHRIPLPSIEPKLLTKYRRIQKQKEKQNIEPDLQEEKVLKLDYESISAEDRQEIERWKEILNNWRSFRESETVKDKAEADERYVEFANITYQMNLKVRTLYRKWKAWKEEGEEALIDKRGRHGNHKKALPDYVWDIFENFYLDQNQRSVSLCMRLTETQLKKNEELQYLPLPSYDTFVRRIEKLPVAVLKYFRLGDKAFMDQCAPYIKRKYDDLFSNDIWVTDNHTFDIMIAKDEAPVRVYLTAFYDVRSRKFTGWYVTDAPRSDATVLALRRGIEQFGIPKMIYSDNGREFLTHDIGGRGFRKSAKTDEHEPMTILQRLGIDFRTALVKNAKAKIIERRFRDVKDSFSKIFDAYTGGHVLERPERLKYLVKNVDNLVVIDDFREFVDTFIANILNKTPSDAEGMFHKCPDEVFAKNLIEMKTATEDELNLMMLRNSKMQKVKRNGVMFKVYDKELWYGNDDVLINHLGESVYLRYNPDDLNEVRIYDDQDRFMCVGKLRNQLSYFASKDEIAKAQKENRAAVKAIKGYKKQKEVQTDAELELMLWQAEQNAGTTYELAPEVIRPFEYREPTIEDEYATAVGGAEPIDWAKAVERLRAAKES
ncbi:MAG: Mu transposase C-terminal domain-containing protein [Lachnospiraceae bacterium]|nr:Mu transposase C-terminal domain-containing protein [Lachnospiraceae bacterium]